MRPSSLLSLSFGLVLSFAAFPVLAAFEFVSPAEEAPAKADTQRPKKDSDMPAIKDDVVHAEPLPLDDMAATKQKILKDVGIADKKEPLQLGKIAVPLTPVVKESDALLISDEPLTAMAPQRAKPLVAPKANAVVAVDENAPVQGFGRSVPLVIALQQIVPPNYRYSFGAGVTAGTRVDWTGGKPWKDVVADVARRNQMNVEIVSNVIALRREQAADMPPLAPPTPPALLQDMPAPQPIKTAADPNPFAPPVVAEMAPPESTLPESKAQAPHETPKEIRVAAAEVTPLVPSPFVSDAAPAPTDMPVDIAAPVASHTAMDDVSMMSEPLMPADALDAKKAAMPTPARPQPVTNTDEPIEIGGFALPDDAPAPVAPVKPVAKPAQKSFFDRMFDGDNAPPVMKDIPEKKIEVAGTEQPVTPAPQPVKATVKPKKTVLPDIKTDDAAPVQPVAEPVQVAAVKSEPINILPPVISPVEPTPQALAPVLPAPAPAVEATPAPVSPAPVVAETKAKPTQADFIAAMTPKAPALPPAEMVPPAPPVMPVQVAAAAQPAASLEASQEWLAQNGQTLRQTLTQWSQQAGVSVVWSSEFDYPLQTDVRIQSAYPDAVRTLLAGFSKAKPRPLGRLFRNKSVGARPVLVVETERLTQ